jgi:hypothetical protein
MNSPSRQPADASVRLGLRENLGQFALLTNPNPCARGEARERRRVCRTTSRRAERGIFHTSGNISATPTVTVSGGLTTAAAFGL